LRHPQPATPQASRDSRADRPRRGNRRVVDRADRLDAADRAGEEDLARLTQVCEREVLLADLDSRLVRHLQHPLAGDAGQDPPVCGGGAQPPVGEHCEDTASGGLEYRVVAVDYQRQLAGLGRLGVFEQLAVGPLMLAEPVLDDQAAQGDASLGSGEDFLRLHLSRCDLGLQLAGVAGRHREAQLAMANRPGASEHLVRRAAGQVGLVEGAEAVAESVQVGVELDWMPVEDEQGLEDAFAWIGPWADAHRGIS